MSELERILHSFHNIFKEPYKTLLKGGFSEPFYMAENAEGYSEIQFRENFTRSALHEVAHWCVAGYERRLQDDFGYWYAPDGRNTEEQQEFYKVEVKPQAIEKAFCEACKIEFEPSLDNLDNPTDRGAKRFEENLNAQFQHWKTRGFPLRASQFIEELARNFNSV